MHPPVTKKEIWSWCLYDFANSSFAIQIVTDAYSIYFASVVAKGQSAEALWGRGHTLSMIAIGLLSPFLGAVADYSGAKKRYLVGFTLLSVCATGLLFFVGEGDILLGLSLFVIGNIGYHGGITFYDAFLKEIADPSNMGRISGYGWALGYLGGLASLLIVFPFRIGGFAPENLLLYRMIFVVTAIFFLLFSLPIFFVLRERALPPLHLHAGAPPHPLWAISVARVGQTIREIRRFRELAKYFVAYFIYTDGINTVIVFVGIFAQKVLSFTPRELTLFFIFTHITSAIGTSFFGLLTDRIGAKRTISLTLIIWIVISLWAFVLTGKGEFYLLGLVAGVALGANQSASRTLLGLFVPREKNAEFFGFFSLTSKASATIGPLVYGEITHLTGSQRWGVLSIGLFFLLGLILLQFVNENEGRRMAQGLPPDQGI